MGKSLAEKEKQEAREARLRQAIANDDVAEVYELIGEEPELLDRVSKNPFPNTPLHLAAAAGKTQVAMEMAIMKPSFARKLNRKGYSPMHLALQHKHYQTVRALMSLNPKLIRVRGQGGITPLHFVAGEKGDNEEELLDEFLRACKSSIEDLTSQRETAVHLAVKNHNLKAFKVLFRWLMRVYLIEILSRKDQDGNTVLHIAILEKQPEIIMPLIGYTDVLARNNRDKTAMDLFRTNPSGGQDLKIWFCCLGCLSGFRSLGPLSLIFSTETNFIVKFRFWFFSPDESARSLILAVATLIATTTYQAALTPPGGYWQDSSSNPPANSSDVTANSTLDKPHQAGNVILSGSKLYNFMALNSMLFFASVVTIWITAVPLLPRTVPVYILTLLIVASFFATALIEFPESDKATGNIIEIFFLLLLGIVLALSLCLRAMYILLAGGPRNTMASRGDASAASKN